MRGLVVVGLVLLAGCTTTTEPANGPVAEHSVPPGPSASPSPTTSPTTQSPAAATEAPAPGTVPPPWLATRLLPRRADGYGQVQPTPLELRDRRFTLPDVLPMLPGEGFAARVSGVPDDVLARSTWGSGCPVGRDELAWVRLTFWGYDDERHTGELLVSAAAAEDLVSVFRTLYERRFPLEELRITRRDELDAPPTGDGNATGVFVCRPAVGTTTFSQHAYGLAIDVNPFQNPYVKGDGADRLVLPELASAYLARDRMRPGMVTPEVVAAFAAIGWEWGGDWQSLKDYQHFSLTGR